MAQMIPVKGDESITRKMMAKDGKVALIGYTVKVNKDDPTQMRFDRITLIYPGAEQTPAWVLERAARTDWISIQSHLRKVSDKEREAFEGQELDCSDLDTALGKEKAKRKTLKTRIEELKSGQMSVEEFQASLTPDEKALLALALDN
jgi:hypothetical protein